MHLSGTNRDYDMSVTPTGPLRQGTMDPWFQRHMTRRPVVWVSGRIVGVRETHLSLPQVPLWADNISRRKLERVCYLSHPHTHRDTHRGILRGHGATHLTHTPTLTLTLTHTLTHTLAPTPTLAHTHTLTPAPTLTHTLTHTPTPHPTSSLHSLPLLSLPLLSLPQAVENHSLLRERGQKNSRREKLFFKSDKIKTQKCTWHHIKWARTVQTGAIQQVEDKNKCGKRC